MGNQVQAINNVQSGQQMKKLKTAVQLLPLLPFTGSIFVKSLLDGNKSSDTNNKNATPLDNVDYNKSDKIKESIISIIKTGLFGPNLSDYKKQ